MGVVVDSKPLWERLYDAYDKSIAEKLAMLPALSPTQVEALQQLVTPVYDGNLISKQARTELVDAGLVDRWNGLNFANRNGYAVLDLLGYVGDSSQFKGGLPWITYRRK